LASFATSSALANSPARACLIAAHYHRTVEQWLRNLETQWDRIRAIDPVLFSEKFRRAWLFYLGGAAETSRPHARPSIATSSRS
jgi:cyclopropane fatty-acyl-phospholipid synthase-like methyltransferase